MKIKATILIILLAMIFCHCDDNKQYALDINNFCGVWANKDCELVKTGKYEIMFERIDSRIMASIRSFNRENENIEITTSGIAMFDTVNQHVSIAARDLIDGDSLIMVSLTDSIPELSIIPCKIEKLAEKLVLAKEGEVIEELTSNGKVLRVLFPSGNWQNLELVERIEIASPYEVIKATKDYLGACLQQWQLGTSFMVDNSGNVNAIEIFTNKHSYVFTYNRWGDDIMVYCRAARIRSDNNGTVFDQNIRLMFSNGNFTAYMEPDNFAVSGRNIVIEDSLFTPNACYYGKAGTGIYWSVKEFNDTLIVVNGCGQDYVYPRPHTDSRRILEWFEFAEY